MPSGTSDLYLPCLQWPTLAKLYHKNIFRLCSKLIQSALHPVGRDKGKWRLLIIKSVQSETYSHCPSAKMALQPTHSTVGNLRCFCCTSAAVPGTLCTNQHQHQSSWPNVVEGVGTSTRLQPDSDHTLRLLHLESKLSRFPIEPGSRSHYKSDAIKM